MLKSMAAVAARGGLYSMTRLYGLKYLQYSRSVHRHRLVAYIIRSTDHLGCSVLNHACELVACSLAHQALCTTLPVVRPLLL
jgi:hypothetical protein